MTTLNELLATTIVTSRLQEAEARRRASEIARNNPSRMSRALSRVIDRRATPRSPAPGPIPSTRNQSVAHTVAPC